MPTDPVDLPGIRARAAAPYDHANRDTPRDNLFARMDRRALLQLVDQLAEVLRSYTYGHAQSDCRCLRCAALALVDGARREE